MVLISKTDFYKPFLKTDTRSEGAAGQTFSLRTINETFALIIRHIGPFEGRFVPLCLQCKNVII